MDEDTRLIEEYLSGDEGAVEELVEKYQKQLFAFIYRMINDLRESEDLTQQTFINAIRGMEDFRRRSSFKTWLYRIALNTCRTHLRQNRHENAVIDDALLGSPAEALANLIEKEKRGLVERGLAALPERQRLAVVLRAYDGLSCIETATVMGCSEGAAKTHYHLGVKRLREIMKEKGYEVKPR
jgi:RNA polymerase sigma-70 factor (ECF subfamily)